MNVRELILSVTALAVMGVTLSAHHSTVAYGENAIVLKNATISKVFWASPHIILSFDVHEDRGAAIPWSAETGSPGSVTRAGWNRNSVKPGDKVTVEVYPARNGAHVGRLKKITFADGKELLDTQNPTSLKK